MQIVKELSSIKAVKPLNFLFFRTRTKANELGRFVGIISRQLHRDAALNDLEVTGPSYWNYHGFDGNASKEFTLEIALPVSEMPLEYGGKFKLKRTNPFLCVSMVHYGSWYDMPDAYRKLLDFATGKKLTVSNYNREIYINVDFTDPGANVTEIQIGISEESLGLSDFAETGIGQSMTVYSF